MSPKNAHGLAGLHPAILVRQQLSDCALPGSSWGLAAGLASKSKLLGFRVFGLGSCVVALFISQELAPDHGGL